MSQFTAAKLAQWVGIGFATLMISILLLGLGLGYSVNHTYKEMANRIRQTHESDRAVQAIRIDIGQLRRFEKDYFLQLSPPQLQIQNIELWHQAFNRIDSELKRLEQMLPEQDQATIKTCHQKLMNYKFGFEQTRAQIKLVQIQSPIEANEIFTTYKHFIYQLDESMSQLSNLTEKREFAAIAYINSLRTERLWQMGFAISICFSLSGLLAFLVSRNSYKISKELEYRAEHDPLTGLLNRRGFENQIMKLPSEHGALLYLDLDQFKLVNDLCGHSVGDDLLTRLSHRIISALPAKALIARLGGDEFGIYLAQYQTTAAKGVAEQLLELIQQFPFSSQGRMFALNGSIGISIREAGSQYIELIAKADTACYIAKQKGTGQIAHSSDVDHQHEQLHVQMSWATKIPHMLSHNRFVLFYQKMENLQTPSAVLGHAEILLRGLDENGQIVPPGYFLPAAERFNLINRIDRWVAQAVLSRQLPPQLVFAINLSGPSLGDLGFLQTLEQWVKASPLPAQHICFEITETAAMTEMTSAKHFISTLKALGCRFALDDFGSGFSSFSYLKELQVDYLKIDGSMIRNLERNASDVALVTAIIQMAKALDLRTIAEFVENDNQKEILRALGVDYAQGFGIHKPEALPILN